MFSTQPEKPVFSESYEPYAHESILSQSIRINFVRKVFSITAVQLIVTTIFTYLSITNFAFARFQEFHTGVFVLALLSSVITALALGFSNTLSRKVPINYILLSIFTLSESYLIAFIASQYDEELVLMALFLTAAVVTTLALYALSSKTEITYFGALIIFLAQGVFIVLLLSWFVQYEFLQSILFATTCLMSGLYLIYDIKLIMGKEQIKLSLDDYIRGAMNLYIDIVRIFLKILEILAKSSDDNNNKNKNKRK